MVVVRKFQCIQCISMLKFRLIVQNIQLLIIERIKKKLTPIKILPFNIILLSNILLLSKKLSYTNNIPVKKLKLLIK